MKVLLAIAGLFVAALAVSAQSVPKDWLVSLERTGCVGTCPVYKIEIDSGGTVTFRNRHNEITKDKLSVCHIQELYKLSETEQFLNLKSDYVPKQECDGPNETDWPSEVISIIANGRSRTITHNVGCKARPNTFLVKLVEFASAIDRLTNDMFIKD